MINKHTDIKELVSLAEKGNQVAQLQLYKLYYLNMYNVALRYVTKTEEAEDIMQEAVLVAFSKLPQLKEKEKFGGWLKMITIRMCLLEFSKNRLTIVENDGIENVEDEIEDELTWKNREAEVVFEQMKHLHDKYKEALLLYYVEGYDYEEMSELLHITQGNCRTLVSRARKALRKRCLNKSPST
jgi:RNA polymerase sigma-70 factor (ECF subfamily)